MSNDDKKPPYVPVPPNTKGMTYMKPIAPEVIRAETGIEKAPLTKTGRSPSVTQTRTVTMSSSTETEVEDHIQPHGKALIDELLALAFSKSTKDTVKLQVINSLLDRGFGKPTQKSESISTVADLTSLYYDAVRKASK